MQLRQTIPMLAITVLILAACGDADDRSGAFSSTETTSPSSSTPSPAPDDASTAVEPTAQPTTVPPSDGTSVDKKTHDTAALQGVLDSWRSAVGADGATLSIRTPGTADISLVSGVDDRDPDTPMPPDGTFYAASVFKTFVTAITLQLVSEGRLTLDDTVEPWLPELPTADQITVRMLLDHTAGLADWQPDLLADLTRRYDGAELVRNDANEAPHGAPGERFTYSNANYTAAALLLERELGMTLAEIVDQRILIPLALGDTSVADGSTLPTRHGWFSLNGEPSHPQDNLDFPHEAAVTSLWGAGNLLTSSRDLLTWGQALYSGQLLGPSLTAEMVRMRNPFKLSGPDDLYTGTAEPTPLHYGLGTMGFCLDPYGCKPDTVELVGHGGSIAGSRALVAHDLTTGTTFAVHANTDDIPLAALATLAADVTTTLRAT